MCLTAMWTHVAFETQEDRPNSTGAYPSSFETSKWSGGGHDRDVDPCVDQHKYISLDVILKVSHSRQHEGTPGCVLRHPARV